jgi:hypothetical protein
MLDCQRGMLQKEWFSAGLHMVFWVKTHQNRATLGTLKIAGFFWTFIPPVSSSHMDVS